MTVKKVRRIGGLFRTRRSIIKTMVKKEDLKKISNVVWKIPKTYRDDMRVPARIYANEKLLDAILEGGSVGQLVNLTTLPGIVGSGIVMPDAHEGYGSPIGGVFATRVSDGIISPGAVGYDINCGVRLLYSKQTAEELHDRLEPLAHEIMRSVPSGLGHGRKEKMTMAELDAVLEGGVRERLANGYATEEDVERCEGNGKLEWADASMVSHIAKMRGADQLGTLGSGNHFLEIQKVDEIFDEETAKVFGLFKGQVAIMIHTGSRGLGHQIATDHIKTMIEAMDKYGISIPDRELACAPFRSEEGQRYFAAMACGANFAWANRQMITWHVRNAWQRIIGDRDLRLLYDVAHNIAKKEGDLLVHRKGATRAFPPHHPELPEVYKETGQPVIIPGSMGTASYVLAGMESGREAFYSACHGAGRTMSRHEALRTIAGADVRKELETKHIVVKATSTKGLVEEAPQAYKDVDEVVDVVREAGLARKVARLVPLAVIKGE